MNDTMGVFMILKYIDILTVSAIIYSTNILSECTLVRNINFHKIIKNGNSCFVFRLKIEIRFNIQVIVVL